MNIPHNKLLELYNVLDHLLEEHIDIYSYRDSIGTSIPLSEAQETRQELQALLDITGN